MPDVSSIPYAPQHQPPPVTAEPREYLSWRAPGIYESSHVERSEDWAQLAVIDLAKMNTPEGQAGLVETARNAMRDVGFFYVVNHGWSPEQVNIRRRYGY